jgi:hypothetical protein
MQAQRSQFVLRLMPSFADFAFLMPIALLFGRMAGATTLLGDCDTGWHIRTGQWIAANHWVPARDIFSFSKPGDPWYAWEWLSDLAFAWINAHGGLRALVLFTILLLCGTFALLYRLLRRKANVLVAFTLTTAAAAASSIHWLARPHLFTLLFLLLFYAALENVREGKTRLAGIPYLALLPLVVVLWTNLHGGFFVGILLICLYGGGELLQVFLTSDPGIRQSAGQKARAYFLSAFVCGIASLANPYTYHLHVHVAQYLRDPWNGQHIAEFLSPTFHHPTALFFEVLLVLGALAAYSNLLRGSVTEALVVVMWGHGALLAGRNVPIFALLTAPMAAGLVQSWLDRASGWNVAAWLRKGVARFNVLAARVGEAEAVGRWHLVSAAGVAAVAALLWAPHPLKAFRAEFDPSYYPAAALATLRQDASARIFTNDEWGDYLIWSLYPGHRVFVDGRSDFYGDDFEARYVDVLNVKDGWETTLGHFGVDTILLPPDAPLAGALKQSNRWKVVYDDSVALVFRPSSPSARSAAAPGGAGGNGVERGNVLASGRPAAGGKARI